MDVVSRDDRHRHRSLLGTCLRACERVLSLTCIYAWRMTCHMTYVFVMKCEPLFAGDIHRNISVVLFRGYQCLKCVLSVLPSANCYSLQAAPPPHHLPARIVIHTCSDRYIIIAKESYMYSVEEFKNAITLRQRSQIFMAGSRNSFFHELTGSLFRARLLESLAHITLLVAKSKILRQIKPKPHFIFQAWHKSWHELSAILYDDLFERRYVAPFPCDRMDATVVVWEFENIQKVYLESLPFLILRTQVR